MPEDVDLFLEKTLLSAAGQSYEMEVRSDTARFFEDQLRNFLIAPGPSLAGSEISPVASVERILLKTNPVTKINNDQGKTELCWAFSVLNVLETSLLNSNGLSIELSRGFLQSAAIHQRVEDRKSGIPNRINDRGTFLFAIELMDKYGIVPQADYPSIYSGSFDSLHKVSSQTTEKVERSILESLLSPLPKKIKHLGESYSPLEFAKIVNGQRKWVALSVANDENRGWGLDDDPDARKTQQIFYTSKKKILEKIRANLRRGIPSAYGTRWHGIMVYGADYAEGGEAIRYYVIDSLKPDSPARTLTAQEFEKNLKIVLVAQ